MAAQAARTVRGACSRAERFVTAVESAPLGFAGCQKNAAGERATSGNCTAGGRGVGDKLTKECVHVDAQPSVQTIVCWGGLVLPDRIELSTSPLPMECSTTELRQRAPDQENRPKKPPTRRADPCHKAPSCASARAACGAIKMGPKSARDTRGLLQLAQLRADPVPHFLAQRL
jgi:hypothetical protein